MNETTIAVGDRVIRTDGLLVPYVVTAVTGDEVTAKRDLFEALSSWSVTRPASDFRSWTDEDSDTYLKFLRDEANRAYDHAQRLHATECRATAALRPTAAAPVT